MTPTAPPARPRTRIVRSTPVRVKRHSQATSPLPGSGRTCAANPARRHISRARRTASGANATKPNDDASRPHPINDASRRRSSSGRETTPSMRSQRPVRHPSGCRPSARTACTTATRRHHQQCKAATQPSRHGFQKKKRHARRSAHSGEFLLRRTISPGRRARVRGRRRRLRVRFAGSRVVVRHQSDGAAHRLHSGEHIHGARRAIRDRRNRRVENRASQHACRIGERNSYGNDPYPPKG